MIAIRILLIGVEDQTDEVVLGELARAGYKAAQAVRIAGRTDLARVFTQGPLDLVMYRAAGDATETEATLKAIREADPAVAVIVVSEPIGEEQAIDLLRAGADDFLLASNLGRLASAVPRAVAQAAERRCEATSTADVPPSSSDGRNGTAMRLAPSLGDSELLLLAGQGARVALWESDLSILRIRYSSGWTQLLGRPQTDFSLEELWDLVHVEDRAMGTESMQAHMLGQAEVYEAEQRMLHADGTYRWVLSRGVVRMDEQGRRSHMVGVDVDVTDRHAIMELLQRSEEKYRNLVEEVSDVVYAADREGLTTYVSPAAKRIYGYEPESLVGRGFVGLLHPDDVALVTGALSEALLGRRDAVDHRLLAADGTVRWVRNQVRLIIDGGEVVGIRGVLVDITRRHQAEEALQQFAASLEQQVAERTESLTLLSQRFQLLADNASDMLCHMGMDGLALYVSPAHERVLGYRSEDLVGRQLFDLVHPEDFEKVVRVAEMVRDQSAARRVEYRYRHADGHYVWLETSVKKMLDENGTPIGAVLLGRDVTERRLAEDALRQSEERFSNAFELATIGKAMTGLDGRWLKVNRAFCELVGYSSEELLGMRVQDFTLPEDLAASVQAAERLVSGDLRVSQAERRYVHKSGETVWANLSSTLVYDSDGAPLYFLAEIQDIGARKVAEADLQRLHADLEQRVVERTAQLQSANEELQAFNYTVSHDLRAPLRVIEGYCQILLQDLGEALNDEAAKFLGTIGDNAIRMASMLDNLLKLSRLRHGELNWERVDLSAMARDIAGQLQRSAPGRKVVWAIADEVTTCGDPGLLRELLENLLGNAWKYTGAHDSASVEFGVSGESGEPVYFVRDDGAGFDMAYATKLFGVFQRLHRPEEFEGTGVGLAIVHRVISRHGGRLWAEAAVEKGATFYFTLPPPLREREEKEALGTAAPNGNAL